MGRAARLSTEAPLHEHSDPMFGVAAGSRFGKAAMHVEDGLAVALHGRPTFLDGALASLARDQGPAVAAAQGWGRFGAKLPTMMSGNFALAVLEPLRKRAFLAIDRMGVERLCYARRNAQLVFGASAQSVAAHPAVGRDIDPQAIYDYLYFHMIPSPRTLYRGIEKLLPGQCLLLDNGEARLDFYWQADYAAEAGRSFESYRGSFRELLRQAVGSAADQSRVAVFLSGGTDSSTVVGALTEVRGAPVDTFSIGFDAQGFDEMEFARCAAERFGARAHEIYVKPQDIVAAIPDHRRRIRRAVRQQLRGAHVLSAPRRRARPASTSMLAGDGGDEIFGGNTRYAKQKLFEAYFRLPAPLRRGLIEPIAHLPGASSILPLRKLRSYVDQANVRLPLRLETYNFLHRSPLAEIFEPEFIAAIDPASTDAGARRRLRTHDVRSLHQPHDASRSQVHAGRQRSAQGRHHDRSRRGRGALSAAGRPDGRFRQPASRRLQGARHPVALVLQGSAARPAAGKDHQQEQARLRPAVRAVAGTAIPRCASSPTTAWRPSSIAGTCSRPTSTACSTCIGPAMPPTTA